jgi:uncharacterized OsmC-like protein
MPDSTICVAVKRVENALTQKPGRGVQPDTPAQAVLTGGLGMQVHHPNGHTLRTDMPTSLGGGGEEVSPGWLMRAGLASCTATVIALRAERLGIRLTKLEVTAHSSSDARGMLGLDPSVPAGLQLDMQVDIQAENADEQALAELVAWADEHSPIASTVRSSQDLRVSVNGAPARALNSA